MGLAFFISFFIPAPNTHTSGECITASPLGSSSAHNIRIGSFDQIPPRSTTHILTHLFSRLPSSRPWPLPVFSLLAAAERRGFLFFQECLREVIRHNERWIMQTGGCALTQFREHNRSPVMGLIKRVVFSTLGAWVGGLLSSKEWYKSRCVSWADGDSVFGQHVPREYLLIDR